MAADNKTLGRFTLGDIPPAPRGIPQIEVTFDIDANGIVNVSAKDLGTGKSKSVTIQNGSGLSEEEIQKMVREAEENAEADKKKKEEADLRNEAEQVIFAAKKAVEDLGSEVTENEKKEIEDKSAALRKALEGNDIDEIRAKKDELLKASQGVATRAYQKAQQAEQNKTDATDKKDDDNVVEAEFDDVK
jgi:molecular chaperone DnaK